MNNDEIIINGINDLKSEVTKLGNKVYQLKATNFDGKNVLTLPETAEYCGFSEDYIYRHRTEIGFSKPNSKNIFFEKTKIDLWLLRGASKSQDEIDREVKRNVIWGNSKQNRKATK